MTSYVSFETLAELMLSSLILGSVLGFCFACYLARHLNRDDTAYAEDDGGTQLALDLPEDAARKVS